VNWDAIGAIGEIVGAIAVVATLLYLAAQTRINTNAVKTSTFFEANESLAEMQLRLIENPDLFQIMVRAQRGEVDFNEEDWLRFDYIYRSLSNRFEAMDIQYREGFVDKRMWQKRMGTFKWIVSNIPAAKKWWAMEKEFGIQDERFIESVDSAKPMSAATKWSGAA
jgi:hypothetical protein